MKFFLSSFLVFSINYGGFSQTIQNQNNLETSLVSFSKNLFSSLKTKNYSQFLALVGQKSDFEKLNKLEPSSQTIPDETLKELLIGYKTSFDGIIKTLETKGVIVNNLQFKDLDFTIVKKKKIYASSITIHTDFLGIDYPIICDKVFRIDTQIWKQFGNLELDTSYSAESVDISAEVEGEKSELNLLANNSELKNEFAKFSLYIESSNWEKAKESMSSLHYRPSDYRSTLDYLNAYLNVWVYGDYSKKDFNFKDINTLILESSYKIENEDFIEASAYFKDKSKINLRIIVKKEKGKYRFYGFMG